MTARKTPQAINRLNIEATLAIANNSNTNLRATDLFIGLLAISLTAVFCQTAAQAQNTNVPPQFMGRRWGIDESPTTANRSKEGDLAVGLLQMYRVHGYTDEIKEQLKTLLAVNLRKQSNIRNQPKSPVDWLITSEFDSEGLKLILEAQKRDFKANDIRLATTIMALAKNSIKQEKYKDALDYAKQALTIQNLYTISGPANNQINLLIADCLRETGKPQEAKELAAMCSSTQIYLPRSKYYGHDAQLQTGVELAKLKSTYNEYLDAAKQCPYSNAANDYLKVLIPTLISQRDYERATTLLRAQIEIYARTPNSFSTGCTPSTEPIDAMLASYEKLAALLKAQGKDKEAAGLISEVEAFLPGKPDYLYTLALAKIAVAAGAKDQAQKLIDNLGKLPHPWQNDMHRSMDIYSLYNSLGEKEKAQKYVPYYPGGVPRR